MILENTVVITHTLIHKIYTHTKYIYIKKSKGYTVTVPALPGCITYGEDVDEAMAMAKEAVELYIEELKERGNTIPDDSNTLEYSLNLDTNSKLKIRVNGHTDNVGKKDFNVKLSYDRAKFIAKYIVKSGIKKDRIEWEGFADEKPIADNSSEKGRSQNRRVEFEIIP